MNNPIENFDTALKEIFEKIMYNFSPKEIDILRNSPKEALHSFHFGLGVWIRNSILRDNPKLCEIFEKQNISHLDDISVFIIQRFYEQINQNNS